MSILNKLLKKKDNMNNNNANRQKDTYEKLKDMKVSGNIEENTSIIKGIFDGNTSVMTRNLTLGKSRIKVTLFFMDGMTNAEILTQNIVKPIVETKDSEIKDGELCDTYIKEQVLTTGELKEAYTYDLVIYELLSGYTVIFIDGCNTALIVSNKENVGRNVDKADTEQSIRGSKAAFVENMDTNIILLRNMIKSPDLMIESMTAGQRSRTSIAVVYIRGIIDNELPLKIKKRISEISIDGIVDSSQVQALIQKHKWTILPQMLATERIDRVISAILDGRAAVIVEGTPFVLIIPTTFSMFLSTTDDKYGGPLVTSILKVIRYIGFFEACSISALYLALTTFHPGLLPTSLALSITGSRVGLPFPVALEIIIMEITLYLIQEAALRLPKAVGQTVGIVGGLVIGQAVVQAGIVSPIIVIIVSMSAIASFTIPNYTIALSTIGIRLFLIASSTFLGLYGFVMGSIALLIHMASLESFGVKYLVDYSPYSKGTFMETLVVAPLHTIHERPEYLNPEDKINSGTDGKVDTSE